MRATARQIINETKKTCWSQFVLSITSRTSSKGVWAKVKMLNGPKSQRTITLDHNNSLIHSEIEVANILVDQFAVESNGQSPHAIFTENKTKMEATNALTLNYNRPFLYSELAAALDITKSTAPGPDNIPYEFLCNIQTS